MNILLGVSASVACYKACAIASKLTQAGVSVDVVLTRNASRLIAAQLFHAITGRPATVDEFAPDAPSAMAHITLADRTDLLLVAPATAATISRLSCGAASDLLTTLELVLEVRVPRLVAPAMNPRMYAHPAVQANLELLRGRGWEIIEPQAGWTSCGDIGVGRMREPEEIVERILTRGSEGA